MDLGVHDSVSDPVREPGTILDQRYRVEEALGEGPVHSVHRGWDILDEVDVCLKIPKPKFRRNDGFTTRYRRDLLDIVMLHDKNWLTPLQIAEHEGVPFQVLPLVRGAPFLEWFESTQRNETRLIQLLTKLLKTLARLQSARGRHHGAVKPSNLFVLADDEPLLTDLAATGRLEDHFAEKATSGDPVYCAPEQLCGERSGVATDLYSLGILLYEALARRHPFFGPTPEGGESLGPEILIGSLLSQLQSPPPPPSHYAEDVPRWADRFLLHCLQPHPQERFEGPEEALEWLKNHTKPRQDVSAEQRTVPPPGREREMKYLEERVEQVLSGENGGDIICLRGEMGVGKSRSIQWLVSRAKQKNMRVVEVEPIPESGLHLQSVTAALFPDSAGEQSSISVVESTLTIALEEPVLMVIRDVQQADSTLVEFLKELETVLVDVPLLLVLVDEETEFRSAEMRAFIIAVKQTLRLEPLDRQAVANLIEEKTWTSPTSSVCSWVHAVSGGNALHANLLVEYLQARGLISDAVDLAWTTSPPIERPSLIELIAAKLESLTPTARNLLEISAVLGNPFRLSTLNAITYRNEDEVDEALGEGVGKGLVELTQGGGATTYRWKHPTFRKQLVGSLPARRRQRIHRLAAAYYSRGIPEPAKMAYHFLRAGDLPELFYWGSLAVEKAQTQHRRGEVVYWMNVLLSRIPEFEWMGPDIQKTRQEVTRDQADLCDLETWPAWFRALSGRAMVEEESDDPLLEAQRALSSQQPWGVWRQKVERLTPALAAQSDKRARRALVLLSQEWQTRCAGREPFPTSGD